MPRPMTRNLSILRALVASLALLLPFSAASPAVSEEEFDSTFAPFDVEVPVPDVEGNVVDLHDFEPPIEEQPETTVLGTGMASYYGQRFHGRRTANGERFNMHAMTAAHKTLPFGTKVRVTNASNGRSVVVRINDRGPYAHGRTIDLSRAAATEIGLIKRGHGRVQLELLR